jgi:hypothetical protein
MERRGFYVVAFFHWEALELFTRLQWNHSFKPTVPMQFSNFSSLIRANEYYEIILKHYNCSLEIMFQVHLCHYRAEAQHREQLSKTLFLRKKKKHGRTNILNFKWFSKTRIQVRNIKMPTCYLPESQTQCCYLSCVLNLMCWSALCDSKHCFVWSYLQNEHRMEFLDSRATRGIKQ